jgi:hypothetical protein
MGASPGVNRRQGHVRMLLLYHIEGVDKLVVTQPVVDGAALLASTEQVEVQELTQVCRDRRGS